MKQLKATFSNDLRWLTCDGETLETSKQFKDGCSYSLLNWDATHHCKYTDDDGFVLMNSYGTEFSSDVLYLVVEHQVLSD